MSRSEYYESLKKLAIKVRKDHNLASSRILPSDLKQVLKAEGVSEIVLFHDFKNLRGAYLLEDGLPIVVVKKNLPRDPYAFTLGHELKHHLVDQEYGSLVCTNKNISEAIEIGAEVFSAEFLYPEEMFIKDLLSQGIGHDGCSPENIVNLKKETDTTLSYAGLAKRAVFLKLAKPGTFDNVSWKKLEEELFGVPVYKTWTNRRKDKGNY
ncbi:ImmA/IrrE family metallo-endopeptidase [Leptospira sp. WS92.C1]